MKLSIAIATHNEEDNIARCLEAVYDWADEIVIVDGSSTDGTTEIIEKFPPQTSPPTGAGTKGGAKIRLFIEDNPPMFHINKQKAIERCRGEWILQLDADEVVSNDLKDEILEIVNSKNQAPNTKHIPNSKSQITTYSGDKVAYWIARLNYFLGRPLRKGGQYPDYTIRLYKNGVAHFPCRTVHEQVEIDASSISILSDPDGTSGESKDPHEIATSSRHSGTPRNDNYIGYLKAPLLHFPYPTFGEYLNKWKRYCTLEAEILKEKGVKPSPSNFFKYFLIYPNLWFLKTYFRHKGFVDGIAGFVFSLFSALRYWIIYLELLKNDKA